MSLLRCGLGNYSNTECGRQRSKDRPRRDVVGDDNANGKSDDVVNGDGVGVFVSQRRRFRTVQLKQKQIPEKRIIKRGLAIG